MAISIPTELVEGGDVDPTATPASMVASIVAAIEDISVLIDNGQFDKVADNTEDIQTVGLNIADINSVATDIHKVGALADNTDNINLVATNLGSVNDVSANMLAVLKVYNKIVTLTGIADSLTNIDTLADNMSSVLLAEGNIPEITTVLAHIEVIQYIADNWEHLNIVYDNLDGLLKIDTYKDEVINVSTNMATILAASVYVDELASNLAQIKTMEANVTSLEASTQTASTLVSSNTDLVSNAAATVAADKAIVATNTAAMELLFDQFDDRYLGSKSADPTVDNDGDALLAGVVYFNTTSNTVRFYTGALWEDPDVSSTNAATAALASQLAASVSEANSKISEEASSSSAVSASASKDSASGSAILASTAQGLAETAAVSATNSEATVTTLAAETVTNAANAISAAVEAQSIVDSMYYSNTTTGLVWNKADDTYLRTGSSNFTLIQEQMKRCVLNADGTVNYFLNPYNSNFKEDGVTASVLTGADGNVMVQIPAFFVRWTMSGDIRKVEISQTAQTGFTRHKAFYKDGVEVDYRYYRAYKGYNDNGVLMSISGVTPTRNFDFPTFRTLAQANGSGWGLTDWYLLDAIKTLYLIEFGTFNSQSVLGQGNSEGGDYGVTTGKSNDLGNGSSDASNSDWMSYRGIENLYGDVWEAIDGINVSERAVYLSQTQSNFASDVYSGDYVSVGVTVPSELSSYISNINFSENGFIPTAASGGSSTTYVTDGVWSAEGSRVAYSGGAAAFGGTLDGVFAMDVNRESILSGVNLGGSVSF